MPLFFFNDPAPTEIYPLSLHDALPICLDAASAGSPRSALRLPRLRPATQLVRRTSPGLVMSVAPAEWPVAAGEEDRKSNRLNPSPRQNSYAVFCLKKKTLRVSRIGSLH